VPDTVNTNTCPGRAPAHREGNVEERAFHTTADGCQESSPGRLQRAVGHRAVRWNLSPHATRPLSRLDAQNPAGSRSISSIVEIKDIKAGVTPVLHSDPGRHLPGCPRGAATPPPLNRDRLPERRAVSIVLLYSYASTWRTVSREAPRGPKAGHGTEQHDQPRPEPRAAQRICSPFFMIGKTTREALSLS
jgi:hypothetical protein